MPVPLSGSRWVSSHPCPHPAPSLCCRETPNSADPDSLGQPSFLFFKAGPESSCSLHMCARRRRVFRQGQQKSRELSWGDTLLPSGETHLLPLQHKARGYTSLRTLISFTSPPIFMGLFCNSGVTCRCVMLGPQLYFRGWLQGAHAVVPTAEPRTCLVGGGTEGQYLALAFDH